MTVCIRPATRDDAPALASIRRAVGWETASVPGQMAAQERSERSILLAVAEAVPVGVVTVEWVLPERPDLADGRTVAHVNDRAVRPEWQRRGIGGALMDAAEREAWEAGRRWMAAQVPPSLPHVRRECEQRGYTFVEDRDGFALLRLDLRESIAIPDAAWLRQHFLAALFGAEEVFRDRRPARGEEEPV